MADMGTRDETAGTLGSLESLLREEIACWRDYIQQREADGDVSVPERAFDALALAEEKLSLLQITHNDVGDAGCRMH